MTYVMHCEELLEKRAALGLDLVTKLDLGSGLVPKDGFTGMDLCGGGPSVIEWDLTSGAPWPFGDEQIEELASSHFIEHVPLQDLITYEFVVTRYEGGGKYSHVRSTQPTDTMQLRGNRDALVWVMEEAWRVARMGARFHLRWPALRDEQTKELQPWTFADPTHRRYLPPEWLHYLSLEGRRQLKIEQYGWRCNWTGAESAYQADLGMTKEHGVHLVKAPLP